MTRVLLVGCPYCGASSREPCVNQQTAEDMSVFHGERYRFAARILPPAEEQPR